MLAALDAAFAGHDAAALRAQFAGGPADASQLVEFQAMPGARLSTKLIGYARNGDAAFCTLVITHAMDDAPEEQMTVRWELRRADGAWRIANAIIAPVPAGTP